MNGDIFLYFILITAKLLFFNSAIDGTGIGSLPLIVSIAGAVLILIFWTNLLPRRVRLPILYILDCVITFVIIADMLFFRYFNDILSMPVLEQASVVTSVKSSVASLLHGSDLIFVADILIIPIISVIAGRKDRHRKISLRRRITCFLSAIIIGIGMSSYGILELSKTQPGIFSSFYDKVYIAQNIGLLSYHGIDAFRYIKSQNKAVLPVSEEDKREITEFLKNKKSEQPLSPGLFGIGKDKNLIVVQVEALQEFVIGRSVEGREITPNLNKLIKNSLYFDNYYTQTAAGGTSDAELLSNVSMHPAKDGAAFIRFPMNDYYSLAGRLSEEGYLTSAMHAFKPDYWNRSTIYKAFGFDEFISKEDYVPDEISGMGLTDKSFFRQSLEYMEKYKEPYYTFLITLTGHFPYENDKRYFSDFNTGKYKDTFFGNYLEAIHYADEAMGEFIGELESRGLLDRSVLAVYGDHFGIPKDKKEYLADFLGLKDMDDYNWVRQQKIPLIIHLPKVGYSGTKHIAGGGLDFMPTILNIMGFDSSNIPMLGRDLLNSSEGMVILRNGYFITDKYICLTSKGVAYDAENGSTYPMEKLEKEKELALRQLRYSDMIMENNLARELLN
ncbi:MAG: LTA synthase family protein [Clostridiaceae bacterium]|nr:LTA synthase family protein [Clostridiaceae bacterium]